MIYILCLNPSIDVYQTLADEKDGIYHTKNQFLEIGGKGINVALALRRLGIDSRLILPLGGPLAEWFEKQLTFRKISYVAFSEDRPIRLNFKILGEKEIAYNVQNKEWSCFEAISKYLQNVITSSDTLIVSGSGSRYLELLKPLSCRLILDVDGKSLKELSVLKPYLVKPNREELKDAGGKDVDASLKSLLNRGCRQILCTLDRDGAVYRSLDKEVRICPIGFDLKTTVGCGDAFLSGFLFAILKGFDLNRALHLAGICAYYRGTKKKFISEKLLFKWEITV